MALENGEVSLDSAAISSVANGALADADEAALSQYVSFYLGDECFAFPMESVLEIIRVPDVVPVPMTSSALLGLANLRGVVLPLVDMREILALEGQSLNDTSRAIVVDCGRPIGLVVDRVSMVLSFPEGCIEDAASIKGEVKSNLLQGVAKNVHGHKLIQIFDVDLLIEKEFGDVNSVDAGIGIVHNAIIEKDIQEQEENLLQMVSLLLEGQEYAFQLADVREIVRVPDDINKVPLSDSSVLGLMSLRDHLLPLVSLRKILSMPDAPIEEHNRVLVVSVENENGEDSSIGILVDQMKEILRVSHDSIKPVPSIMSGDESSAAIQGVCRLGNGERIVSLVSAAALFGHPGLKKALKESQSEIGGSMMNKEIEKHAEADVEDEDEAQLVVFQLDNQDYGVAIEKVQEIIRVPERVEGVPQTPDYLQGVINLRGAVLPVVEMRLKLGFSQKTKDEQQRVLVLNIEGVTAGFIVDSVSEVLRLGKASIERSTTISNTRNELIDGIVNIENRNNMIQVVNVGEMLDKRDVSRFDTIN
ncbi:MAG: chemotaxis protein CheW [Robiginitomaculum sp.]|nr:chemotaxis protein CheW [Robiginitomaculum sp.]